MREPRRGPRLPQVNLFVPPSRGVLLPIPARYMELVLVGAAVLIWGGVGVAIAMLFGWHPSVGGVGP